MLLDRIVFFLVSIALLQKTYTNDLCTDDNVGIVGGHALPIEDAPYTAALKFQLYDSLHCAAAIVHERFLLTAAGCHAYAHIIFLDSVNHGPPAVPDVQNMTLVASVGSVKYQNNSNNIIMEVEKFLCHEAFDKFTGKNDICLVKLQKSLSFGNKIAKIKLPEKDFEVKTGTILNVTGWGSTKYEVSNDPDPVDLQQTTITVVSHQCCHKADRTVDSTMLCAGAKGRGPCIGDAGDPLTYKDVLVGIASHIIVDRPGPLCGSGMDVYTRVARFVDWINYTITNNL